MFVTSHVLAGATIGTFLARTPSGAFMAGVVSHFAMDACPHWGIDARDPGRQELFIRVARCDGCAGLAAMALAAGLAAPRVRRATVAAMVGAALPDLDKPLMYFFGVNPFPRSIQRFHQRIQRESPDRLPLELGAIAVLGVVAFRRLRGTSAVRSRCRQGL